MFTIAVASRTAADKLSCLRFTPHVTEVSMYQSKYVARRERKKRKSAHTWWEKLGSFIVCITNGDICSLWVWIYGGRRGENGLRELGLRLAKDFTPDVSSTVPGRFPQNLCCLRC